MGLGSKEGERPVWWWGWQGERDMVEHLQKWKEINHIYMPATNLYPASKSVRLLSSFFFFFFFFLFFFANEDGGPQWHKADQRHMEPFSDNIFWKRILKMVTKLKLDDQSQKTLHCIQMHWLLCTNTCVCMHLHASVSVIIHFLFWVKEHAGSSYAWVCVCVCVHVYRHTRMQVLREGFAWVA